MIKKCSIVTSVAFEKSASPTRRRRAYIFYTTVVAMRLVVRIDRANCVCVCARARVYAFALVMCLSVCAVRKVPESVSTTAAQKVFSTRT